MPVASQPIKFSVELMYLNIGVKCGVKYLAVTKYYLVAIARPQTTACGLPGMVYRNKVRLFID